MDRKTNGAPSPGYYFAAIGNGKIKWSVGVSLFIAFCCIAFLSVVIAVIGGWGLGDARRTLGASSASFANVSDLFDDLNSSLDHTSITIDHGANTLDAAVATMEETSNRVNNLNSVDLPSVIAIGDIRDAITNMAAGDRTLLMRQLYDLDIRQEQRIEIENANKRVTRSIDILESMKGEMTREKLDAWEEFKEAYAVWHKFHEEALGYFNQIDELLRKRIRGGFDFEEISKTAFNLTFGVGLEARVHVNEALDKLVSLISHSTTRSAQYASRDTQNATRDAGAAKTACAA